MHAYIYAAGQEKSIYNLRIKLFQMNPQEESRKVGKVTYTMTLVPKIHAIDCKL